MSVAALPQRDPGQHLLGHVAAGRAAAGEALEVDLGALSDRALEDAVAEVAAWQSQLEAMRLGLGAEAERRAVATENAATGTDAWLSRLTGERREQLKGGIRLAELLQQRYPATLTALTDGRIRLEQARIIVDGLEVTADRVDERLRQDAEELLIGKANGVGNRSGIPMPPVRLRRAVRHAYATLDTDVHHLHLAETVRRSESRARSDTWLTMGHKGDGTTAGKFQIPERYGEWLRSVLESLSAPRRYGRDKAGSEVIDESAQDLGYSDWLGLALCELIEHLPKDHLPRAATTMLVKVDLDALRADLASAGIATTDNGIDISAAEARRLACEAGLVPAVLGGASLPLDLGRNARLHSDKQRQALSLIYDSCAIAGCERPFSWTEIHHLQAWADGGRTDLDNAIPVCWPHHRAVEDPRFELRRHSATEFSLKRRAGPRRQ